MMKRFIYIIIIAMIIWGCGENSSSPIEQLSEPLYLSASLQENMVILLTWQDVNSDETGYKIERKTETSDYEEIADVEADIEEFYDENLETNQTYYYRVAALRNSEQSDWSNTAIAHTPADAEAPSYLRVVDLENDNVSLAWNDNTYDETGFVLERKIENGDFEIIAELTSNVTEFNDTEVNDLTQYSYRILAVRVSGNTGWSNVITIITPPAINGLEFGEEEDFEIITWNLKQFPFNDEITIGYAAEAINQMDPDIIALQEINSTNSFNQLVEQLDGWTGYKANSAAYDIDLAYLFKTDFVTVNAVYEIYEDDFYYFPRRPLVAQIEVEGYNFVIFNNHLKASSGPENEARRRGACIRLEEYISSNHEYDNVILLGDLNDELDDGEEDNVFMSFLSNPNQYSFADMDIAEGSSAYWSYPTWPSHLDHIMISNELFDEFDNVGSDIKTLRIDIYLNGGWNEYENNLSDHRPVGLKIEF